MRGAAVLVLALAWGTAAAAQAPDGRRAFQKCFSCHSVDPAETGLPGPNLAGIVGARAGREAGFAYSPAMKAAAARGLTWTEATLDRFLADPEAVVPRTEMSFVGLRDPAERRAVIAYLKATRRGGR